MAPLIYYFGLFDLRLSSYPLLKALHPYYNIKAAFRQPVFLGI